MRDSPGRSRVVGLLERHIVGSTTVLMCAAMDGNLDLLRRHLGERRMQDENSWTALMHITLWKHHDVMSELLDEADIESTREVVGRGHTFPAGTTAKDIAERLIRILSKTHDERPTDPKSQERTDH